MYRHAYFRTDSGALNTICDLWEAAGSVVIDPWTRMIMIGVLGAVSHLPHVAAFSLIHTLKDLEESRTVDSA